MNLPLEEYVFIVCESKPISIESNALSYVKLDGLTTGQEKQSSQKGYSSLLPMHCPDELDIHCSLHRFNDSKKQLRLKDKKQDPWHQAEGQIKSFEKLLVFRIKKTSSYMLMNCQEGGLYIVCKIVKECTPPYWPWVTLKVSMDR